MIWAVAASCTIVRAQQADTTRLWTLPDCMRYAIENSPRAVRQQLANANLKISYNEAILKHLPSLSGSVGASAGFGRNVDPGTNTYTTVSTFSNSYSLGAGITVFNGLQLINNTRASKVAKLRGEEAQRQIEDAISMETMQAYYDYSYTLGTQRLAREQVEASRDNLRQGRRMMELGLRGAADVAQLEATLASDEYNLTKVENNMRSCELKLKEVMNYPPEAAIRIDTAWRYALPEPETAEKERIVNTALATLPDVVTAPMRACHPDRSALVMVKTGKDIREGVYEQMLWAIRMLGVEGELMSAAARRQGHTYDAEVILLILDRMMQGSGVGARLFDGMEQAFRQAGAQRYFLYTNTGCNVGFYDHRGLTRRIERTVPGKDGSATTYYLYDSVL